MDCFPYWNLSLSTCLGPQVWSRVHQLIHLVCFCLYPHPNLLHILSSEISPWSLFISFKTSFEFIFSFKCKGGKKAFGTAAVSGFHGHILKSWVFAVVSRKHLSFLHSMSFSPWFSCQQKHCIWFHVTQQLCVVCCVWCVKGICYHVLYTKLSSVTVKSFDVV